MEIWIEWKKMSLNEKVQLVAGSVIGAFFVIGFAYMIMAIGYMLGVQ